MRVIAFMIDCFTVAVFPTVEKAWMMREVLVESGRPLGDESDVGLSRNVPWVFRSKY
jgi:hypothetical protein